MHAYNTRTGRSLGSVCYKLYLCLLYTARINTHFENNNHNSHSRFGMEMPGNVIISSLFDDGAFALNLTDGMARGKCCPMPMLACDGELVVDFVWLAAHEISYFCHRSAFDFLFFGNDYGINSTFINDSSEFLYDILLELKMKFKGETTLTTLAQSVVQSQQLRYPHFNLRFSHMAGICTWIWILCICSNVKCHVHQMCVFFLYRNVPLGSRSALSNKLNIQTHNEYQMCKFVNQMFEIEQHYWTLPDKAYTAWSPYSNKWEMVCRVVES